jgi:hypothetical protein
MFEQVAIRLLEGQFVCDASAPALFRWLQEEGNQHEVDSYLRKIGRKLTTTPNAQAFYATWLRLGNDERTEAKRVMVSIKQTIRPLVNFLTLCMDAAGNDSPPSAGDRLDYPALLNTVASNQNLIERLREFATMGKEFAVTGDSSSKGMLEKVFNQMLKTGYIAVYNREQESYRFTGKIDYFFQILEFLDENEEGVREPDVAENDDQSTLKFG